ncbi:MAG TPA: hypothetical protein V6C57_27775 [Coleofasciculaceae cyanobacterium]
MKAELKQVALFNALPAALVFPIASLNSQISQFADRSLRLPA